MLLAARLAPLRAHVWGVLLACTYVLVGTWAFTPELAHHSLARDVSATAVPAHARSVARSPSQDGGAPQAKARHTVASRGIDAFVEPARRGRAERAPARVRSEATAAPLPAHVRPRSGQPHRANPPPAAA